MNQTIKPTATVIDVGNGRRVIVLAKDDEDAKTPYFENTVWHVVRALEQAGLVK